jgi:LPXTG-motif cell wall-anchored protein
VGLSREERIFMRHTRSIRLVFAVLAAGLALFLAAPAAHAQYEGGSTLTVNIPNPTCGQTVIVTGSGFLPDTEVTLTIGGSVIGTATTDAEGDFSFPYTVPANCSSGTVVISASDGVTVLTVSLAVGAPTPAPSTTLPRTGSDNSNLIRAGAVLLAVGGLLVLATRKRAGKADASV